MSNKRHTANLLGALSLTLVDRMRANVGKATGFAGEAAASLVTIEAEPDCSIGFIAEVTGLTHSGAVRLIDKLENERLVVRNQGKNARTAALRVTTAGKRRVKLILEAREKALTNALSGLSPKQLSSLSDLLKMLLLAQAADPIDEHIICRLCDSVVCFQDGCPIPRPIPTIAD